MSPLPRRLGPRRRYVMLRRLGTAGVGETADVAGRQFGVDGIEGILLERRDDEAAGILDAIERGARSHRRTDDDRTLLVIRVREDEEVDHGT